MIDLSSIFDPAKVDARNAIRFRRIMPPLLHEQSDLMGEQPTIGPDDLPGDWRCEWEERAAIMEYDGNMPRERAEAMAMAVVLRLMEKASSVRTRLDT